MSRRVLILALLVAAVGGWLLLRELPALRHDEERALRELRIFQDVPSVVDSVRIRRANSEILVVRDPDDPTRWWLRSPIVEEIPRFNARDLIGQLTETERWRRVAKSDGSAEWSLYGLGEDSPGRVRIELIGEGHRSAVDVGLLTPSSTTAWVRRVGSDELDLCLEGFFDLANASHQGLRDTRLFRVQREDLALMRFTHDGESWTTVRDSTGLWYLDSLQGPRLRRWIVEDFALATAGLRVDGFLRDDLAAADWSAYGLDDPWGEIYWRALDGRTGTVWLGNELGDALVFGRRAGLETVFQFAPGVAPIFGADLHALEDHNPIARNFLQATTIRVDVGDGYVEIGRASPGVKIATEKGPVAEEVEYDQVVGRNLQLGVEEFQPLAEMYVPAGKDPQSVLDPVEAALTVHWPDRDVRLHIGRYAGGVWVAIEGDQTLYEVGADLLLRVREIIALHGRH